MDNEHPCMCNVCLSARGDELVRYHQTITHEVVEFLKRAKVWSKGTPEGTKNDIIQRFLVYMQK